MNLAWRQAWKLIKSRLLEPIRVPDLEETRLAEFEEYKFSRSQEAAELNSSLSTPGLVARVTGVEEEERGEDMGSDGKDFLQVNADDLDPDEQHRLYCEASHGVLDIPAVRQLVEAQVRALAREEALQGKSKSKQADKEETTLEVELLARVVKELTEI